MDKDEAIKEFLKALRVALKSVLIYQPEHAAVVQAGEELKKKIDALLKWINPLKIGFTQQSLHIDDRGWENDKLYREIAKAFHQRKIKGLEIRQGIDLEELMILIANFSLPVKEIALRGGIKNILEEEEVLNITVEELDYSQLLKGDGEELQDVWTYLLSDAVDEDNAENLDELADNFDRVIYRLNPNEIAQVERLRENFSRFFSYLKENNEVKYSKCAKDLVRAVLRDKNLSSEANLEKLKSMVGGLSEKELASLLHEEIISNEEFDALSFSLFSRLTEGDRDNQISSHLTQLFKKDLAKGNIPEFKDKIKRLLFGTETSLISENYRKALSLLLEGLAYKKSRSFDPHLLPKNFRFMLLNLLDKENKKEAAGDLLELILKEWDHIIEDGDFDYLRSLLETLKKKERFLSADPRALQIERSMADFVEKAILEGADLPVFSYFINTFQAGRLDVNIYLKKIFSSPRITPHILRAFFKFHPDSQLYFNINLQQHADDTPFMNQLIENLQKVDSQSSLTVLKTIFAQDNREVKIRALQAMQHLSRCDDKFLFRLLKKEDLVFKKEAMAVLAKFDSLRPRALEKLLGLPSFFGLQNRVLLDHLGIVKELNLRPARSLVASLARRGFPWNKKLREEALRLLEDWDARKN
jgi:hypothetical protein